MSSDPSTVITGVTGALGAGLPHLLAQFLLSVLMLYIAVRIYMLVTPFNERELVARGNAAAGTVLCGAVVALALPMAALLATSFALLDILIWGMVALLIQLLTLLALSRLMRELPAMIEAGNVAAALAVVGGQIGVALLNAAAMVPY